jgi:osmoprotectant transport system substrate-binding protein
MRRARFLSIALSLALLLPVLAACGTEGGSGAQGGGTPIKVASKGFNEAKILGEMYALLLEDAGLKVDKSKIGLGTELVAHEALKKGEIDLYAEYTGTGFGTILGRKEVIRDPQQVYDIVKNEYKSQFNLVWLEPAPMNNSNGVAMTQEGSNRLGVKTLSEFVAKAPEIRMAGPTEFQERPDGLAGMREVFGPFQLKEYKAVASDLKYTPLLQGQVEAAVAFGTDGEISANNLVLLRDDKNFFPPYRVAPVVRQQVLDQNPKMAEALNKLAPKLTNEVAQRLNNDVTANKKEPATVAKEFLQAQNLIKR